MSLDHSTDAISRDLTKERDEAQQREIERLTKEVTRYRGRWLTACVLLAAGVLMFASGLAAQSQAGVYFKSDAADCPFTVAAPPPGSFLILQTGTNDPPSVTGAFDSFGLPARGSLLDPTRRIDR